jgi:hypothetical protein
MKSFFSFAAQIHIVKFRSKLVKMQNHQLHIIFTKCKKEKMDFVKKNPKNQN